MRTAKPDTIAGLPARLARDLMKTYEGRVFQIEALEKYITTSRWHAAVEAAIKARVIEKELRGMLRRCVGLSRENWRRRYELTFEPATSHDAAELRDALLAAGLIEAVEQAAPGLWYALTDQGVRLGATRMLKRIPRAKADEMVAELIERARAINANSELLHWVLELRAFGSYITTSPDLGDVDIAFQLERRPVEGNWIEANRKRAVASGKHVRWPNDLTYGGQEVLLLLKGRNQHLTLHEVEELDRLKFETRVTYQRSAS